MNIKNFWFKLGLATLVALLIAFTMVKCEAKGVSVSVCFTPGSDCTSLAVSLIDKSNQTLEVQAYYLTSQPIVDAIIRAKQRGVNVIVLLDKTQCPNRSKTSVINRLLASNIPVYIDYKVAIAHNKVIIIDGMLVIGGSFNYTASAQLRNAENMTMILDIVLAKQYLANFISRVDQSDTYINYHTRTGC